MKNTMIEKTKKIMEELNIKGEIIDHLDTNGTQSEDVAEALNIPLEQVVKCLILKSKKGFIVAAIILGNQKLDMKKIEFATGKKKFSLASPKTVFETTGYQIGGIPPFAVVDYLPVLIDASVLKKEYVIGSAGTPYHGLKFDPKSLEQFDVKITDICI